MVRGASIGYLLPAAHVKFEWQFVLSVEGSEVLDLKDDRQLKTACETLVNQELSRPGNQKWIAELLEWMERVRDVTREEFLTEQFQLALWDNEAVTSTGMGQVDISNVASTQAIAEQLWDLKTSFAAAPTESEKESLVQAARSSVSKSVGLLTKRNPKLKMYRVFALLCPGAFTTIAHYRKLKELGALLGIPVRGEARPVLHKLVLNRIEEILGPVSDHLSKEGAARLALPWMLYVHHVQNPEFEPTEVSDPVTGKEKLNPLPAARRRRGMLSIGGGTETIRAMIEFALEGCTREDFIEHMQSLHLTAKKSTLNTQFNALIAEWGVIKTNGSDLVLTSRGEAFLESGDPDEVLDLMITRILGFDYLLHALAQGPRTTREAILILRTANPGWTKDFGPTSLINWFKHLQLAHVVDKELHLTGTGQEWAQRIDWEPQALPAAEVPDAVFLHESLKTIPSTSVVRPSLHQVIDGFSKEFPFKKELIAQLDAGLWSHKRRHLAVLTGLSGAGKTQLARGYALSLWQLEASPEEGLLIVPVQPGWHDNSSLLGYVNPLDTESYVRTRFLDFLLQASSDPGRPYTLVLDEMNLSHPEQYLAPLLSSMETGDAIELHGQADEINGVPSCIPYPSNLVIIGTVNMDETTHGLSDKVLDRATVIEFWDIDVDSYPGWKTIGLSDEQLLTIRALMNALMEVLRPARMHFGWRTLSDVLGYVEQTQASGVIGFEHALDHVVYAKLLPKLRGEDSPRFQEVLVALKKVLEGMGLTDSHRKVRDMHEDLMHTGSTRFWR